MKKRLFCTLLVAVLAFGLFAPAGIAQSNEPVTLRFMWWGGDTRHAATLKAIERYSELHPNVTIDAEYQGYDGYQQKIMTQIAGGNEPDIMQLDYIWFPDLSRQNDIFVDLSTAEAVDLSSYSPAFLQDYCSINGKVVSLPMGTNGYGIIINKQVFDKHGISTDIQLTWESLVEQASKVNEADPSDYLFAIESSSLNNMVFDQYVLSKTGKYWMADDSSQVQASKEDISDAFTYMQKLFSSPGIQPLGEASLFASQMEQNPIWGNNQLGFTIDWSGTLGKYGAIIGEENMDVANPPIVQGGHTLIPTKPSMVVAVSQRSQHQDVATDFINWMMTDPEAVEILGTQRSVPTNEKALAHLEEIGAVSPQMAKMIQSTLQNPAPPPPALSTNSEIVEIVSTILEEVAYNNIQADAAADKFITNVNDKLSSLNQ